MVTVGQQLIAPEEGWRRYDDRHALIKYIGSWASTRSSDWYMNNAMYTTTPGSKAVFKFFGTKIRLILKTLNTRSENCLIKIDGGEYTYSQRGNEMTFVLVYEKTGLEEGIHEVELVATDTNQMFVDAIDIDDTGHILHPDEVTDLKDLAIGKRIRCHYQAPMSGQIGMFNGLGQETSDFIPPTSSATPNGDFYWIAVDKDHLGRWKLIADRNIQHSISWDTLNEVGIASGSGLNESKSKLFYTFRSPREIASSSNAFWSLPTPERPFVLKFKAYIRGGDYLFSSGGQTSSTGFSINYRDNGRRLLLKTANRNYHINGVTMLLNQWAEYMFVWTGQGLEWYVNGELDASDYVGASGSYSNSQQSLTILRPNNSTSSTYHGDADITGIEIYEGTLENRIPSKEADELNMYFSFYFNLKIGEKAKKANIRLLTGGVSSTDKDNEWDKYIVNSTLNNTITAGDNSVWNWSGIYSWTSSTTSSNNRRTIRGNASVSNFSHVVTSTTTSGSTGFRPVLLIESLVAPKFSGGVDSNSVHKGFVSLIGTLTIDNGHTVSYKVLLNGQVIYQVDDYLATHDINVQIPSSSMVIGSNTIRLVATDDGKESTSWVYYVTLVNDKPVITATMQGLTLKLSISDPDFDKVKFRVELNGVQVFPSSGFTNLSDTPIFYQHTFKSSDVNIGSTNTVTIYAIDDVGEESTQSITFVGDYSGLMFADAQGNFYSTDLGEVLQYLDFGAVIAGQTTLSVPIRLINKNGFKVTNIVLSNDNSAQQPGVRLEMSKSDLPFTPEDVLVYSNVLDYGDEVTFYVRLVTDIGASPRSGKVTIFVKGDPTE